MQLTDSDAPKNAQPATQKANAAVLKELNFADREDFEDAQRGLIAALPKSVIKAVDGHRPGVVLCNQRLEERRRGGSQMVSGARCE